jgi:hypothetical protein
VLAQVVGQGDVRVGQQRWWRQGFGDGHEVRVVSPEASRERPDAACG